MYFSRSLLKQTLVQPAIDEALQRSLVEHFHVASDGWRLLEEIELPADVPEALPPTRDLALLALRRYYWHNLSELRALHRDAVLRAADRPFGLLELMLQELSRLDGYGNPPPGETKLDVVDGPEFRAFFRLVPEEVPVKYRPLLEDLRARAIGEAAVRLPPGYELIGCMLIRYSQALAPKGANSVEPQVSLCEFFARVAELAGDLGFATEMRRRVVALLKDHPLPDLPDRTAEAMADLAELLQRVEPESTEVARLFKEAREWVRPLPPGFNQPLRHRLAPAATTANRLN